jgi:hypothetical protein
VIGGGGIRHTDLDSHQIGIIHEFGWAQMIYVVTGLLQLILVFALLRMVSWLPVRVQPNRSRPRRNEVYR